MNKAAKLPPEEFAFGKPNRPSTPIQGVISNTYGDYATKEITEKYVIQNELVRFFDLFSNSFIQKKQVKPLNQPRQTKAQQRAEEFIKVKNEHKEEKQEFKLKRFQQVEPRTNTFRSAAKQVLEQN